MRHQRIPGERLGLAIDLDGEGVAVCDQVVECLQGAHARGVLDVDDLLFGFGQGVRLEETHRLQPISPIAGDVQQADRVGLVQLLPPQLEGQDPVISLCRKLVYLSDQRLRGLVLGVRGEPQPGVAVEPVHLGRDRLELPDR